MAACGVGAALSVVTDVAISAAQGEKITGSKVLQSAGLGCVAGLGGFGAGKVIARGVAALAGAISSKIASRGVTTLYRAVSSGELEDILSYRAFRQAPDGRSMEAKLFAETLGDAEWWGNQMYAVQNGFHIVQVKIPSSFAQQLERIPGDSRVITAVNPQQLQDFNAVAKITVIR